MVSLGACCLSVKNNVIKAIKTRVKTPLSKKDELAPNIFVVIPANIFPIGDAPAKTNEYTLMTLPLYSSFVVICNVEFAFVLNQILNIPVITNKTAV